MGFPSRTRSPTAVWVRRKLFFGTLILNAFVIGIVALVLRQSLLQYTDRARMSVETLSQVLEEDLSGSFDAIDLTLLAVVDEVDRQTAAGGIDGPALNAFLYRHYARLPLVEGLRVMNEQGQIVYGTGARQNIKKIGPDREYFVRLRDDPAAELVISQPLVGRQNPIWMIILAHRLTHADGSFAGAVFAPVSLETLTRRLAIVGTGPHGRVTLRNENRALIAAFPPLGRPSGTVGDTTISPQLQERLDSGRREGSFQAIAGTDHVERLLSFRKLANYPFLVIVGQATADTFAQWRTEATRLIGLAVLFAITTMLASWLIYRSWKARAVVVRALAEQEAKFRTIADYSYDWEHWIDAQGRLLWVNPAVERLTGYTVDQCMAMAEFPLPIIHPDSRAHVAAIIAAMTTGRSGSNPELHMLRKDGSEWWAAVSWQCVADANGRFAGHRVSTRDISVRKRSEEKLRRSEELLGEVQEVANLGWYVYDAVLDRWENSKILDRILGIGADFARSGRAWLHLVAADQRHATARYFSEVLRKGGGFEREFRIVRPSGAERWISCLGRIERNGDGRPLRMVGTILDITERKQADARIEFLADHDPLTGLPNRLLGKDRLELAMARAGRAQSKAALMFLDLDHFKQVNDSLGHSIGDALLKAVAARLRGSIRETDTICRQGGDEFLIVLDDIRGTEAASRVAEAILGSLVRPFAIEGYELYISASIGIAIYPDDASDFETLFRRADTAMYYAKEAGRNTCRFFAERMNVDASEYLNLRNALRRGLERREFVLHYQPQIDLADGRVVGAEALIRWEHPELGLVSPERFIPVAEDSGLIVPIGEWVLAEACRQLAQWRQGGLSDMTVAVNLSAVQFRGGGLFDSVSRALDAVALDPCQLELELTESILIKDTENVLLTLRRLKALGVKLSIDDFGTGYSSLAYLKRFAVDKLKIDQSFIRTMLDNESDAAIVHAIIRMSRSLGLRTIAEGVEESSALDFLRGSGCDEVQGYLFAKPMPADDLKRFVLAGPTLRRVLTTGAALDP